MKNRLMFTCLVLFSASAYADLNDNMDKLCAKMKQCSLEEAGQQLDDASKAIMENLFDNMCISWMDPYSKTIGNAGLEKKASACIGSIVSKSCKDLMGTRGEFKTAACDDFKKAADEAGVDLDK